MDEWNYTKGALQVEQRIMANSFFYVSRSDPLDDNTLNEFGQKFNVRTRHYVNVGSCQPVYEWRMLSIFPRTLFNAILQRDTGMYTDIPYQPIVTEQTDFSAEGALVKAMFRGTGTEYKPSSTFGA